MKDERLLHSKKSIYAKAFVITIVALWAIVAYRSMIQGQALSQFLDIFLLTVTVSIGLVVALVSSGSFDLAPSMIMKDHKFSWLAEIAYFVVYVALFSWITGLTAPIDLLIALVLMFMIRYLPMVLKYLSFIVIEKQIED